MPDCPSRDDLCAMLDDRLPADREAGVAAHVDGCRDCQQALETLTARDLPSAVRLAHSTLTGRFHSGPPPAAAAAAPTRIGPYRVERELGRGGMGMVYLATHTRLRRAAAVKVIRAGAWAGAEDVARFHREAQAVAAIAHPNVVPVYESGEQDLVAWIALEYVPGGTLKEHLGGRPLPAREAAELARGVARGAAAAHAAGVVHRDIKPANILLAPGDETRPLPRLTDFGLAKGCADGGLTLTGVVVGTPQYMAPEQARGEKDIGPAADVYAVGAVLYELLTGRPPFDGPEPLTVLAQVVRDDPVPVRRLQPSVPRDIQTVCHKCLRKDPAKRYPSAQALADDLDRFLAGRPVTARPVGAVETGWRVARRHPLPAALTAALLMAVSVGVGGVVWKWREADAERRKVAAAEGQAVRERNEAVGARAAADRSAAATLLDRGLTLAERGEVGEGLLWMAEALRTLPEGDDGLGRVVRANLAGWSGHASALTRIGPPVEGGINVAAVSPDGLRYAVASRHHPNLVRAHDADTGLPIGEPLVNGDAVVQELAFGPDGKRLLARLVHADGKQSAWLWDAAGGRHLGTVKRDGVSAIAFRPDGAAITGHADGSIRVWAGDDLTPTGDLLTLPGGPVAALVFTADGKWLVAAGRTAVHRWDLAAGRDLGPLPAEQAVRLLVPSPDGRRVAAVDDDGTVHLWDVSTGRAVAAPLAQAIAAATVTFSPDGQAVLLGSEDGVVRSWDPAVGPAARTELPAAGPGVRAVAVRPDGQTAVTVSGAGGARVWATARPASRPPRGGAPLPSRWPSTEKDGIRWFRARLVAYSPDRKVALTMWPEGGLARLWDVRAGRPRGAALTHPHPSGAAVAVSPDGRIAATSCRQVLTSQTDVQLWDVTTGRHRASLPHINYVTEMAFTADGRYLATGGYDAAVHLWDAATGRRVGLPVRQPDIVLSLALSPDARTLAVLHTKDFSGAPGVAVWDLGAPPAASGWAPKPRLTVRIAAGGEPGSVAFTPDGRGLVVQFTDQVRLYDPATGEAIGPTIFAGMTINATALAPGGRAVLTGTRDGVVRLWELASGRPLTPPLHHPGVIRAVAVAPGGDLILAGCADGTARLWDRATAKPLGPPAVQGQPLLGVAFAADGHSYLTTTEDGTTRAWTVPDPVAGESGELRLRIEARTGLTLGDVQAVQSLSEGEWADRATRVGTAAPGPAPAHWHDARARDAEQDGVDFAARWHLDRLEQVAGASWLTAARRAQAHIKSGHWDAAAAAYDRAAALAPPGELAGWYHRRTAECLAGGQWAAALMYLDRAASPEARDWRSHAARARVFDELGRLADRDAELEQATDVGAGPGVFVETANRRAERGDWTQAVALYQRAADRGADGSDVLYNYALAGLKAGDRAAYRAACAKIGRSVRSGADRATLNNAAWTLCLAPDGSSDYDSLAARMVEVVGPARPADAAALSTLGACLYRAGRFTEAIERLRECVGPGDRVQPSDAAFLAMAYFRCGDPARASHWLARADRPATTWQERAEIELLLREARNVIDRPPVPRDSPPPPAYRR